MTQTTQATPDRWAKFLDEHAPGLTWLAGLILEWADFPPHERRAWAVTASTTRSGDVSALAAIHEETGLCAAAALADSPLPFFGKPERVTRVLGAPEVVDALFATEPMLAVRRLPGFRRDVLVFDGDPAPPRHAMLRRARLDEWQSLERLRAEADVDPDPDTLPELAGPAQRGLVWVLDGQDGVVGLVRIEGMSRRRVQFADACIHPRFRQKGHGAALLRSAAHVARAEYARGAVLAATPSETAQRTAKRAGFELAGSIDDVRLA